MNYNIDSVIKRLQDAKKKGKMIIDEKELIKIETPKINGIDKQLRLIDRGIRILNEELKGEYKVPILFSYAENYTGIPRKTFYRWEKEGILERYDRLYFNLQKLKETLLIIKQIKN